MSNPVITITMENGDVMKGELYPEIAPNTVNNFISLANKHFYDGKIFHRVIPGFMIQRMPGGNRYGWSRILHQRRICTEWFCQRSEAHPWCFVHGTCHASGFCGKSVLHHA